MAETDPEELADRLEEEAEELEHRTDELQQQADDLSQEWERNRADPSVPGAPPPTGDDNGAPSGKGDDAGEDDD
jgi:hypothetical protein